MAAVAGSAHQIVPWRGAVSPSWLNRGGLTGILFAVANAYCEGAKVPQSRILLGNFPFRALVLMRQLQRGDKARACLTGTAALLLLFPSGGYAAALIDLYLAATYFNRSDTSENNPYYQINDGLNPTVWEDACKLLGVGPEQTHDAEFIRSQWISKKSTWQGRETSDRASQQLADAIHKHIERLDSAYQTLTTPK